MFKIIYQPLSPDDFFEQNVKVLVNPVNCVGVMGKGLAKEFADRYGDDYLNDYKEKCRSHELRIGNPTYYAVSDTEGILNFPTKQDWRGLSKVDWIAAGLDWFIDNYEEYGIDSIRFPALGCGNGRLSWDDIGPVMYQKLHDLPIYIEVYTPSGVTKIKTEERWLLASNSERQKMNLGISDGTTDPEV